MRTVCQEQGLPQGRLTVRAEEGLQVRGSTALLTRLLQNLLDNAVKYGREDGHVWVAAGHKGEEIVLSVRDDGIGIEPGQQEKIWQRFYQVDPARSSDRGAGTGPVHVPAHRRAPRRVYAGAKHPRGGQRICPAPAPVKK